MEAKAIMDKVNLGVGIPISDPKAVTKTYAEILSIAGYYWIQCDEVTRQYHSGEEFELPENA